MEDKLHGFYYVIVQHKVCPHAGESVLKGKRYHN